MMLSLLGLLDLRITCKRVFFTPANTGLKEKHDPELGSAWKAAHVKMVIWFIANKVCETAAATGVPRLLSGPNALFAIDGELW